MANKLLSLLRLVGLGSAPPSPQEGEVWFRSDTKEFSGYNGTTTVPLGPPSNMVTTDTVQNVTGEKRFVSDNGSYFINLVDGVADWGGANTYVAPGYVAIVSPRADVGTPAQLSYLEFAPQWWSGTESLTVNFTMTGSAPSGVSRLTLDAPFYAPALGSSGITGATALTRYVGGTTSGAPVSGTFALGDFVVARDGHIFVCTTAGTPGTWTEPFPANMVTTNTAQTITGIKTFSEDVRLADDFAFQVFSGPTLDTQEKFSTLAAASVTIAASAATSGSPLRSAYIGLRPRYWDGGASVTGFITLEASTPGGINRLSLDAPFYAPELYDNNNRVATQAATQAALDLKVEAHTFAVTGPLTVQPGKSRIYLEGNYTITTVRASVDTQPTGSSILVDVNKNGTSIYTTQGNRPAVAASTNTGTGNSPNVTTFVAGDYITVDLDQIGSTIAGSDLTVTIRLRRTS